jgi:hypothetical protein
VSYSNFNFDHLVFRFFSIEEAHNHQNDRIWSAEHPSQAERTIQRQMKPKGVMVWCGVGYNAKAPLIFVRAGVKIDTNVYRREILRPTRNWAKEHYGVDDEGKIFERIFDEPIFFRLLE